MSAWKTQNKRWVFDMLTVDGSVGPQWELTYTGNGGVLVRGEIG